MPNNFHFLVQIKSDCNEKAASQSFGNLLYSYATANNKQQQISGSLFRRKFRRRKINTEHYLKNTLIYIHNNPVKYGCFDSAIEYPWTSYHGYLTRIETFISKDAITCYDGIKKIQEVHR
jgi:hypothetical protein